MAPVRIQVAGLFPGFFPDWSSPDGLFTFPYVGKENTQFMFFLFAAVLSKERVGSGYRQDIQEKQKEEEKSE